MTDYPDIYTDGYSITVGPFGVTLTFMRSVGPDEAGAPREGNEIIARVRMSRELAEHIAESTRNTIAQSKKGTPVPATGKSN